MSKKKGLGKLFAGVAIGAGLGLLFAPKTGKQTRKELKEKIDDMLIKVKSMDPSEVKETIEKKIEELKKDLEDLDKEKIVKIAKEKAALIQTKTEELVKLAAKKGTPVLEKAATSIKNKAIEVTKDVLAKLEEK